MYNILICDDDRHFIEYLKEVIFKCSESKQIKIFEFYSGEALLTQNLYEDIDLIFLDVQMEGMDGIETAMKLRKFEGSPLLVFCSGIHTPTSKAIKANPFRYLMKQFLPELLQDEVKEILEAMEQRKISPYLIVNCLREEISIDARDILYIERHIGKTRIYMSPEKGKYDTSKQWLCHKKIGDLFEQLKQYGFSYAHNSYIVNLRYVIRANRLELELLDGTMLTLARSKEKEFRKKRNYYLTHMERREEKWIG